MIWKRNGEKMDKWNHKLLEENLSALLDGELSAREKKEMLFLLGEDTRLQDTWRHFCLIHRLLQTDTAIFPMEASASAMRK